MNYQEAKKILNKFNPPRGLQKMPLKVHVAIDYMWEIKERYKEGQTKYK